MPQLNPEFFASQIFWLFVSFITLYVLMSAFVLPRIGRVLDDRAGRIKGDLDTADARRADAEAARQVYEDSLQDARQKAQAVTAASRQNAGAEADKRKAELTAALATKTSAAEAAIAEAKARALDDLRGVAIEAAQAIVGRIGGLSVTPEAVQAAVDAQLGAGK